MEDKEEMRQGSNEEVLDVSGELDLGDEELMMMEVDLSFFSMAGMSKCSS